MSSRSAPSRGDRTTARDPGQAPASRGCRPRRQARHDRGAPARARTSALPAAAPPTTLQTTRTAALRSPFPNGPTARPFPRGARMPSRHARPEPTPRGGLARRPPPSEVMPVRRPDLRRATAQAAGPEPQPGPAPSTTRRTATGPAPAVHQESSLRADARAPPPLRDQRPRRRRHPGRDRPSPGLRRAPGPRRSTPSASCSGAAISATSSRSTRSPRSSLACTRCGR